MEIADQLKQAGYQVIHDQQIHDLKYTGAYAHSRVNVEKYLKQGLNLLFFISIIKSFFHRLKIRMENNQTQIKEFFTVAQLKIKQLMTVYKKRSEFIQTFFINSHQLIYLQLC